MEANYIIYLRDNVRFSEQADIREIAQDALEFMEPGDEFTIKNGKLVIFDSKKDDFSILMAIANREQQYLVQIRSEFGDGTYCVHKEKSFVNISDSRNWGKQNSGMDTYYMIRDTFTGKESK